MIFSLNQPTDDPYGICAIARCSSTCGTLTRMALNLPKLREWRKAKGLSLEEVGATLGITKAPVSKWERGEAPVPYERRDALAAIYGKTRAEMDAVLAGPEDNLTQMMAMMQTLLAQQAARNAEQQEILGVLAELMERINSLEDSEKRRPRAG